jgi:hypothetical protein
VSGTVTYEGKPVPAGTVFLDPVAAKGQGLATVKDGAFDTAQAGRGITAGKFVVRVQGFDGKKGSDVPVGKSLFPENSQGHEQSDANTKLDIKVTKAAARPRGGE